MTTTYCTHILRCFVRQKEDWKEGSTYVLNVCYVSDALYYSPLLIASLSLQCHNLFFHFLEYEETKIQ